MPRKVKVTTDHDEIRRWVDARGGWPAMVQRAGSSGELRIGFFDSARNGRLEQISWGEFLQKFDEGHLALEYEERDEEGGLSEFHRLIPRRLAEDVRWPEPRPPATVEAGGKDRKRKIRRAA